MSQHRAPSATPADVLSALLAATRDAVAFVHALALGGDAGEVTNPSQQSAKIRHDNCKYLIEQAPALLAELRQIHAVEPRDGNADRPVGRRQPFAEEPDEWLDGSAERQDERMDAMNEREEG